MEHTVERQYYDHKRDCDLSRDDHIVWTNMLVFLLWKIT